jgi:hypothetical protein
MTTTRTETTTTTRRTKTTQQQKQPEHGQEKLGSQVQLMCVFLFVPGTRFMSIWPLAACQCTLREDSGSKILRTLSSQPAWQQQEQVFIWHSHTKVFHSRSPKFGPKIFLN